MTPIIIELPQPSRYIIVHDDGTFTWSDDPEDKPILVVKSEDEPSPYRPQHMK